MAVKNIVAKDWSALVVNFDGKLWSRYPAGDKPTGYQTAPTLIRTNLKDISLTGGENNKGSYLALFGYGFGRQADLGTATGARVYLRDPAGDNAWHQVDNYRELNLARTYGVNQVMRITVQVGALGGSQVVGRALDVKITVNGVDTNVLTGRCVNQPGRFWVIDNVAGSDATGLADDITKPFRYAQFSVGGANSYTGIWAATTAQGEPGLRAGDTFVFRANAGTPYADQTGFNGRFIRFRSHTGTAPNGTVGNGYIKFCRYPGPILGHAPEDVFYQDPPGGGGFIQGVNTAYGQTYGKYVSVSGFRIANSGTSLSDAGMVNLQNGSNYWLIMDNEMGPWPNDGTYDNRAGGIAGNGDNIEEMFNYIHDIDGETGAYLNHGIYHDASNDGSVDFVAKNIECAYNYIKNITGGSGIQFFDSGSNFGGELTNNKVHHNVVDTTQKYGLNIGAGVKSLDAHNNLIINTTLSAVRFDTPAGTPTINITHNTLHQAIGPYYVVWNSGGDLTTGSIKVSHNTITLAAGRSDTSFGYLAFNGGDSAVTAEENLYYDFEGAQNAVPSLDATYGVYGDPNYTNVAEGDFTVQTGSAALNACTRAEAIAVTTDLYGVARPVTDTSAPGATKNDIGATEGVGT